MPRKRIYHTREQQRLANNAKAKRWRDRNVESIRAKRKEKREADGEARLQELRLKHRNQRRRAKGKEASRRSQSGRESTADSTGLVQKARTLHLDFVNSIPNRAHYVEDLLQKFRSSTSDYRWFDEYIKPHDALFATIQTLHDRILNVFGVGDEWNEVESYRQDVRELIHWIEDVQCYAIEGFVQLDYAWTKKKLRYQQGSN